MRVRYLDYRYAEAVLDHPDFSQAKAELVGILQAAPVPLLDPRNPDPRKGGVKRRTRGSKARFFPVDQRALNRYLDSQFDQKGWGLQPPIVSAGRTGGPETGLKADFKKGAFQVEIQFGNMARWYTDVFKFQLSYSLEEINVAALVVPTQRFANLIDENVAYFERVARELPWAKMSLTLPIWVIGIEPDDYTPIKECYDEAASEYVKAQEAKGLSVSTVPFEIQVEEEPEEPSDE